MTAGTDLVEFTEAEWAARPRELRARKAKHDPSCRGCWVHGKSGKDCGLDCEWRCRVFKCRAQKAEHCCGRYVGACLGGADDDRCANCWARHLVALKRKIVSYVRSAPGGRRREDAICRKFAEREGSDDKSEDSMVEDLVFELVREGRLSWDEAANDAADRALWYRATPERS